MAAQPVDRAWAQAERERLYGYGGAECPHCGAELMPEDCGALQSCEKCGWLGKLPQVATTTGEEE